MAERFSLVKWRKHDTIERTRVASLKTHTLHQLYLDLEEKGIKRGESDDWIGGTRDECVSYLERGDLSAIKRAEKLSKQVEAQIPVKGAQPEMVPTVAGGMVSVAAHLAGTPLAFRRPDWSDSDLTPVKVFADIGCSAGVNAKEVQTRGLAILAFARVLSKRRPVELVAFSYFDDCNTGTRDDGLIFYHLGLRPVHWPMAGAIIGHSSFLRDMDFKVSYDMQGSSVRTGCVGWGRHYNGSKMREVVGAKRIDVLFDRGYNDDRLLHKDPVAWVKRELDRFDERVLSSKQ
jgi:hypothetical protein